MASVITGRILNLAIMPGQRLISVDLLRDLPVSLPKAITQDFLILDDAELFIEGQTADIRALVAFVQSHSFVDASLTPDATHYGAIMRAEFCVGSPPSEENWTKN